MNRIEQHWADLRSSFWFFPSLIVVAGAGLAVALTEADAAGAAHWLGRWPRLFGVGAEGARQIMSTISGSIMTVLGVTFSMILMVLALASSEYTPRILRNFMRNRPTQAVLGIFAGVFTYCLIVLRTIRRADEVAFVPHLSVTLGVLLAVLSVGVLIYFIHHVSVSIQANEIVARVGTELIEGIARLFPENIGRGALRIPTESPDAGFLDTFDREARPIGSAGDGFYSSSMGRF